jgi:hypothetical protein
MYYRTLWLLVLSATLGTATPAYGQSSDHATENVLLITLDGLRWEELFAGADSALLHDERYVDDVAGLRERFWRDDPVARREALLPFFWRTIAEEGQLYGHRTHGCTVDATNNMLFSYPGYNEILTGAADDDRIDSNDKRPNPNVTVLEFVHRQEGFQDRVAAFGSWDVFPYIINEARSGVPVNAGFETATGDLTAKEQFLNELQPQIPSPWGTVRLDAFTHHYAMEHLKQHRPRLLYVAYGETDDFGHDGDYQQYLHAARRTDAFIEALWTFVQSDSQYRDTTTLLITTDHGRGAGDEWTSHGTDIEGARDIWIAALGPDTPPRGEVTTNCEWYQNQVASTVAALLGLDYAEGRTIGTVINPVLGQ